jgi:tetratricopeptide (TPR) repeat protein
MKRLLFVFMAILVVSASHGQKAKVAAANAYMDNGDFKGAKQRIEEALVNPSSIEWPKTYIVAARLSTEDYSQSKNSDDALKTAGYYMKAIELDQKGDAKGKGIGKFANEIKMAVTLFIPVLQNSGIEAFNKENFELSMKIFENVALLHSSVVFQTPGSPQVVDSVYTYYTGLSALRCKNWAKAEEYFNKSLDIKYAEGDPILLLHEVYASSGDSAKIDYNLKRGIEMFPQDERIMMQLINYYLNTKQNDKALEYLDAVIVKNPADANRYFVRGYLLENSNELKRAEADYLKAVEYKPDYYEPLISLGVIYFNEGAEQTRVAQDIADARQYEAAIKVAQSHFQKALPYVEKADSVKPNDAQVLETLKNLYYRLEMMDKYNEVLEKLKTAQ